MKKVLIGTSIILLLVSFIALPTDTSAKTIQEFEEEVNRYTEELENKKANLAKNEAEVQEIINKIKTTENQIEEAEKEIQRLQEEIEASQKEIERKSEESKNIIAYYQVSNGENAYLEYAFGASDITDMIYRLSIVEQLTEYNEKIMKELEELIKKNQATQEELRKKEEELKELKASLKAEQARIEADSASLRKSIPSTQELINSARDSLKYYKSLGCGTTEDIQSCEFRVARENGGSLPSVGFFSRPIDYGYVVRGMSGDHIGYDLSSGNKNIAIHPIASGVIHSIYSDSCTTSYWCSAMGFWCNGNAKIVVIKHNYNGRFIYSSYIHLSSYANIWEGQYVTKDTIIGYMGTTGCSTGEHLHLEIPNCFWKNGGCSYGEYTSRMINPASLINIPGSWSNR